MTREEYNEILFTNKFPNALAFADEVNNRNLGILLDKEGIEYEIIGGDVICKTQVTDDQVRRIRKVLRGDYI